MKLANIDWFMDTSQFCMCMDVMSKVRAMPFCGTHGTHGNGPDRLRRDGVNHPAGYTLLALLDFLIITTLIWI